MLFALTSWAPTSGAQSSASDWVHYLFATRHLSTNLRERRIPHTLTVVPGEHDNEFNRGPAGLEMLLHHDRALAREPVDEN